jgi:putative oxidoreductase
LVIVDTALFILRLVVGLYVAAHGAQKLLGWFGGPGLKGTEGFLGGMLGFRPAKLWALSVGLAEFGGGLLLALGLLAPLGSIGVASAMITATLVVHWAKGPWGTEGGYEQTLTNFAVAVAVAFAGVGRYSVDSWLGIVVPNWLSVAVAALAALGVLVSMATRKTAPAPAPAATAARN